MQLCKQLVSTHFLLQRNKEWSEPIVPMQICCDFRLSLLSVSVGRVDLNLGSELWPLVVTNLGGAPLKAILFMHPHYWKSCTNMKHGVIST